VEMQGDTNLDIESNTEINKQQLRHQMKHIRSAMTEDDRRRQALEASIRAESQILSPLRRANGGSLTVFSYVSFGDEPDTNYLIDNCIAQGDRVLIPKIAPQHEMELYRYRDRESLITGRWGIAEPRGDRDLWPLGRWGELNVVIVPGLAFDATGGRIGYGGGYYDRFMSKLLELIHVDNDNSLLVASLVLDEQLIEASIPMEDHDFRVDMLFTASRIIYTGINR
jgi:5-formyltetrahydrofolate cyclo-ligase